MSRPANDAYKAFSERQGFRGNPAPPNRRPVAVGQRNCQRKILANETEKVTVQIAFRVEKSIAGAGVFTPIGDALRESGSVLADSIASLITVIVAAIPSMRFADFPRSGFEG